MQSLGQIEEDLMLIIGVLLFGAAVAVGADVVAVNDGAVDVDAFGQIFSTSIGGVFVAGVVAALAACFGLLLIVDGAARRRSLAAEAKAARAERHDMETDRQRAGDREEAVDLRNGSDREIGADEQIDRKRHRLLHRADH
jgi:hypothetical protein